MIIKKITKEQYPPLLKQITSLPPYLDMAGTLPSTTNKYLCIVGARKYSQYGANVCQNIIHGLQGYPITIVSGLAIGIDSIAHEIALDSKLSVIAFPGSGLSNQALYPSLHRKLANKIIDAGGTLLSPFGYEQQATNWTFPVRNRLMAGSSHATLVVEAKRGSGTLITADYAAEFARDILTVPGSIFSELSYGPHMLIRRGATPVCCSADVLEALGFEINRSDGMNEALPNFAEMSLTDDQRKIIDFLKRENLSSSKLIEKTSFPPAKLNPLMTELEIRGIIKIADGFFSLVS